MLPRSKLHAYDRALKLGLGNCELVFAAAPGVDLFLELVSREFCACGVDLIGSLRHFREHRNMIVTHFHKPARHV